MCNGWSNYETWNANLWFGDMLADMASDGVELTAESVEDLIWDLVREECPQESSFVNDCVTQALRCVNWQELADHYQVEEDVLEDA